MQSNRIISSQGESWSLPQRWIPRWDTDLRPDEGDMEFRLTYEGALYAHQDHRRLPQRNAHIHSIRREFHKQLDLLWRSHPILQELKSKPAEYSRPPRPPMLQIFAHDGFNWLPIVNSGNGLICRLDILLLRSGPPGGVTADIDNRVKTIFDALRKASGPAELRTKEGGDFSPDQTEDPFYVLLEDDKLITHVSVTSDMLLEQIAKPNVAPENAVRLVITVTVRPYMPFTETVGYA
jgi:hypothetical protein